MFSKKEIIKIISESGHFVDDFILNAFIKNWKIESIYQDEEGIEYYDKECVDKILEIISKKISSSPEVIREDEKNNLREEENKLRLCKKGDNQMEDTSQRDNDNIENAIDIEAIDIKEPEDGSKLANRNRVACNTKASDSISISSEFVRERFDSLAKKVARTITSEVSEFLKTSDFLEKTLETGAFKRDNELLAKKIRKIIEDNKTLIERVRLLERENKSYVKIFGNLYKKLR